MSMTDTKANTYEITLEPSGKTITAKEGQTLLDAAIRNGIEIPYGCRHGNCSACKAQVLEGDYRHMERISEYSLMSFERDEGYILMCSTLAESDLVIEIEEEESTAPFFPVYDFEAEVTENRPCTPDIHSIKLALRQPLDIPYAAGQFMEIDIPGTGQSRAYSMANVYQKNGMIEFQVKRVNGGKGSNYMCDLRPSDRVTGSGPYGKMQLRDRNKDLVFIAGGSGMAPIKALLEELLPGSFEKKAWFFYGARTKKDLYLTEQWADLEKRNPHFRFIPALSQPEETDEWDGETGYIADVVKRYISHAEDMDAFLCGPPVMIDTSIKALSAAGIKGSNVFYDEF